MGYPEAFEGFMVTDKKNWSDFKIQEVSTWCHDRPIANANQPVSKQFKPKPFEEYDIDVKIEACGVCGSDVHTITGGWGEPNLPLCVGHEVVGKAIKVGDKVTTIKVGDRVGVGAQIWACLDCKVCNSNNENYCPKQIGEKVFLRWSRAHRSSLSTRYLQCPLSWWHPLSRWIRQPHSGTRILYFSNSRQYFIGVGCPNGNFPSSTPDST